MRLCGYCLGRGVEFSRTPEACPLDACSLRDDFRETLHFGPFAACIVCGTPDEFCGRTNETGDFICGDFADISRDILVGILAAPGDRLVTLRAQTGHPVSKSLLKAHFPSQRSSTQLVRGYGLLQEEQEYVAHTTTLK